MPPIPSYTQKKPPLQENYSSLCDRTESRIIRVNWRTTTSYTRMSTKTPLRSRKTNIPNIHPLWRNTQPPRPSRIRAQHRRKRESIHKVLRESYVPVWPACKGRSASMQVVCSRETHDRDWWWGWRRSWRRAHTSCVTVCFTHRGGRIEAWFIIVVVADAAENTLDDAEEAHCSSVWYDAKLKW